MTDTEYEKQRKRVMKFWDKWYDTLGMHWWRIEREWERERDETLGNTMADTRTHWQYRMATIRIFLPAIVNEEDDMLEEAIVHEFVHVLIAPLHDFRDEQAREITEHTVTTIARQIINARQAGEEDANAKAKAKVRKPS